MWSDDAPEGVAVRRSEWQPKDRRSALLTRGADPATQRGIEFGALHSPIVRPPDGDILFADYASTAELRAYPHYAAIDKDAIVEVDYVWAGSGSLADIVGEAPRFDYAIASHVIEHVPNVLGWFRGIHDVLRPGGVLNLAIPDRRYTFDVRRPPSTLGQLVEADLLCFRHPSIRQAFDHCNSAVAIEPSELWRSDIDISTLSQLGGDNAVELAMTLAREIVANGAYFDSHCWVFTPTSFLELLHGATKLGLVPFVLSDFQPTEAGECEFFATLRRPFAATGDAATAEMLAAVDQQRSRLGKLANEQTVREGRTTGEVARWRAEAERWRSQNATLQGELAVERLRADTLAAELRQAATLGDELRQAQLRSATELARQRQVFEASTSWALTAPLRRLRRAFDRQ